VPCFAPFNSGDRLYQGKQKSILQGVPDRSARYQLSNLFGICEKDNNKSAVRQQLSEFSVFTFLYYIDFCGGCDNIQNKMFGRAKENRTG
jgi:hypothetical protein